MTPEELNKACEWMDNRLEYYAEDTGRFDYKAFLGDFRKAMGAIVKDSLTAINLTWEDIKRILDIGAYIADYNVYHNIPIVDEAYYSEVLRRFKEGK